MKSWRYQMNFMSSVWAFPMAPLLGVLLMLIALIYMAQILTQYWTLQEKLTIAKNDLNTKKTVTPNIQVPKTVVDMPVELSLKDQQQARLIARLLGLNWAGLLHGLEHVQTDNIALKAVVPDADKSRLVLSGQAKNYEALIAYIQQLQTLPQLKNVFLQQHSVDVDHPQRPVNFELVGVWMP